MSQVFVLSSEGWKAQLLDAERYHLVAGAGPGLGIQPGDASVPAATVLLQTTTAADANGLGWVLLPGESTMLLNGEPLVLGLALLRHKDELRFPGTPPLYFSAERLATVEPCARDDAPRCPRCAQPIARGESAVRCPGCGVLHHQLDDRKCWTHLPRCGLCEQATDLDAGFTWTPETL